jgi:hypothetical protein
MQRQKNERDRVQSRKLASTAAASGSKYKELNFEVVNIRQCCGSNILLFKFGYYQTIQNFSFGSEGKCCFQFSVPEYSFNFDDLLIINKHSFIIKASLQIHCK